MVPQVSEARPGAPGFEVVDGVKTPVPIAVSGDLKIMPPKTGLPMAAGVGSAVGQSVMEQGAETAADAEPAAETTAHGN